MNVPVVTPRIIVDTREQLPWTFADGVRVVRRALDAGDYSLERYEDRIAIERKSLDDLVRSLTTDRDRFMTALGRLRQRRWHAIIVEGEWISVTSHAYRSRVHPSSLVGTIAAIIADGTPVVFASTSADAAVLAERLLVKFHKRARAAELGANANGVADRLAAWPDFAAEVRDRLGAGRDAYRDRSFSADPTELVFELEQEALDLAGWGYVLWHRLQRLAVAAENLESAVGDDTGAAAAAEQP